METSYVTLLVGLSLMTSCVTGVAAATQGIEGCVSYSPDSDVPKSTIPGVVLQTGSLSGIDVVPASAPELDGIHTLEPGERMLVRGTTNLRPDQNVIMVTLEQNGTALTLPHAADSWGTDGVWSKSLRIPSDLSPGTYSLDIDAGVTSKTVDVRVANQPPVAIETAAKIHPRQRVMVVDNATLPHGGFVVVSNDSGVVGTSEYFPAGSHRDIGIFLGNATRQSQDLTAELWYGTSRRPCAPYNGTAGDEREHIAVRRTAN